MFVKPVCVRAFAANSRRHRDTWPTPCPQSIWRALGAPCRADWIIDHISKCGYAAAAFELTHIINTDGHDAALLAMRAVCRLHMGAARSAAEDLTRACALAPTDAVMFALHAMALADLDSAEAARDARARLALAQALLDDAPNNHHPNNDSARPYVALAHAKIALLRGHYQTALHEVDSAVQKAPSCALVRSLQADLTLKLTGARQALPMTQAKELLIVQSPHMQAIGLLAQVQLAAGAPAALNGCQSRLEALQAHGASVPYVVLAAAIVAQAQSGERGALRIWEQAPKAVTQQWLCARVHRTSMMVGLEPGRAAQDLRLMYAGHNKHPDVRAIRARLMESEGRIKLARGTWARLAEQTQAQVRSDALWAQAGRPKSRTDLHEKDRAIVERLLEHEPSHAEALYQLANRALIEGQHAQATDLAQKLLAAGDETGRGHFVLGMTQSGPAPKTHFERYLAAPRRDAALVQEARLYLLHQAYQSEQWKDFARHKRALLSEAVAADVLPTLVRLQTQYHEKLTVQKAQQCIAAIRQTCQNSDASRAECQKAIRSGYDALEALDSIDESVQDALQLELWGQLAWLHCQRRQYKEAKDCLINAREVFVSAKNLTWPKQAQRAEEALRAARTQILHKTLMWVAALLTNACRVYGMAISMTFIDYIVNLCAQLVARLRPA